MAHSHQHSHAHSHSDSEGLTLAFWLNLFFAIIETIGGILTNSTAIIADSFHDFMDAVAIGLAVFLEKVSGRKRSAKFSFGYRRFSLLSAVIISLVLFGGAIVMIVSAIYSFSEVKAVNSLGMLGIAILGIAVNGFAFFRLHLGEKANKAEGNVNFNNRAVMLHLLEDVLGWVAVFVGSIVIYFTNWYWIDGLLAILIGLFIGYNAIRNLLDTMKILLQSVPENVDMEIIEQQLEKIEGVVEVHDFHVWSLDGAMTVASVHLVVTTSTTDLNSIHQHVLEIMQENHIDHPTVQIESGCKTCTLND